MTARILVKRSIPASRNEGWAREEYFLCADVGTKRLHFTRIVERRADGSFKQSRNKFHRCKGHPKETTELTAEEKVAVLEFLRNLR